MSTLLRIDGSPMGVDVSFSRKLTDEFVQRWQFNHPDGKVIQRDLAATPLAALDAEWITAAYTPEPDRTPRQQDMLALSDELITELQSADEYVVGAPMHNFSVSGALKLWIDQVLRAGKTFSYAGRSPTGLLKGKKVTLILTSGGVYEPGTPMAAMDFAEPYLRSVFAFIGVMDAHVIRAGGTAKARDERGREAILQAARAVIHEELQAA